MLKFRATALGIFAAAGIAAAVVSGAALAEPSRAADPQELDPAIRPGDDFYRYANGPWLKSTRPPEGRPSIDTTAMLRDETALRVQALIEAAAGAASANRIGDFYAGFMDVAGIEAKGLKPLSDELAAIAAIADRGTLSAYLGRTLRLDDGTNTKTDGLFGVWIHQGFHDGTRYVPHFVQGGLGLPDPQDYLDAAAEKAAGRELYRAHIAAVLALAGLDRSEIRAARVLGLETAIAGTHASRADTDDVFKTDNPWRRADFAAKAPGMDWDAWFKSSGLDRQDEFLVWQPSAITGTSALVGAQPIEAWQDYLAFHLVEHYAAVLPKAFGEEDTAFLARLSGQPAVATERTQLAIAATTLALGEEIGRLYVERYFPPAAKAAAQAMVENIRSAFRTRIEGLAWMSPATRDTALAKLATLKIGVGYPDAWIDWSGLSILRDDASGNMRRAEEFAYARALAKLDQPVDPAEWSLLLPQKVGAVINFSPNSMQFSAGILQPPYFDPAGDAAANYGSAGAGLAHEVSHTFDELGAIYDADGRLVRWWTPDDLARYRAASAPLVGQFNAYCPQADLCVKGDQVLGEDIADLAGLLVAHDAYILSLGGKADAVKDGLTGDQRFFLAFARRWRRVQSDDALRRQIATDSHAPGEYRADTVRNSEDWLRAYDVKAGDKLYVKPEERPHIW